MYVPCGCRGGRGERPGLPVLISQVVKEKNCDECKRCTYFGYHWHKSLVACSWRFVHEHCAGFALRLERICGTARERIPLETRRDLDGFHHRRSRLRAHIHRRWAPAG